MTESEKHCGENVWATCVFLPGGAVLLRGPSGSGKSDLALRLLDRGAALVADDRTCLIAEEGRLMASPPENIAGKLEVRHIGIVRLPYENRVPVVAVFDLDPARQKERLPDPAFDRIAGIKLPVFYLDAFEESAPAKVRLTVDALLNDLFDEGIPSP